MTDRLVLACPLTLGSPVVARVRLPSRLPCEGSFELDRRGPVDIHVVLRGRARFESREIGAGDVLVVRGVREVPANDATSAVDAGGAESLRARYLTSHFATPLSPGGATVTHVPAAKVARDETASALVALLRRDGMQGVLADRLFDALFVAVETMRLAESPLPLPAALVDARLARMITELHARHAQPWTVSSMAKLAGMSRAAFARRFDELTGMSPHAYLARFRMHVARTLLSSTDASVTEVAERVGYRSESVFSRAFKRLVGEPPAVFRRTQRVTARAA